MHTRIYQDFCKRSVSIGKCLFSRNLDTTRDHSLVGRLVLSGCIIIASGATGCAVLSNSLPQNLFKRHSVEQANAKFLSSGSIILSQKVPARTTGEVASHTASVAQQTAADLNISGSSATASAASSPTPMAPLIGYFPPTASYLPADNETWLEIHRDSGKLLLFKGKSLIKEIEAEGAVNIKDGDYYLQHKQKQPLWYASDEYFKKRRLALPTTEDRLRYRRGALGKYAIYPTMTFPIHCAPVWSDDVGGLRISAADLSSIYYMLPVGAPIVVK